MADVVIAVASKVAEGLVKPTIRQGQYLFCVNKVTTNLHNEKEELILEMDRIQHLVEQAKKRTEIIEEVVEKWLNDVKDLLKEVDTLEQEMKETHCFRGWCPNWRRYFLCKEMAKKTKTVTDLKNRSRFESSISRRAPLPGIEYISSRNFTYFESTREAYNQLMETLKDDDTYMIGLYGMGGSGKTTLVTEVGKKALELNLFDQVILVSVSQTPNIRRIQGKIADMLNLTLTEESEEGRAQRLWLRLREEKRILMIVDDVWEKLNLETIGIRLNDNKKLNFKVILTTRLRRVCTSMDCQREILLDLLSKREGWILFQKHAGIGDEFSSNLLTVAREVSKECKGLPIAIEAVGSSLKGKGDDEWEVALEKLRHSEPYDDIEGEGVRDAFNCLKLSYDYLRNKQAEILFLLCSTFPEDYEIFIEDLIRYGVGLGICGNFSSFNSARSQIRASINILMDCCLLLRSGQGEHYVKMHDMVRNVALWIASRSEHHKILVNLAKDVNSLLEDEAMKDYFAVSSWYTKTDLISHKLDAPKLEILLLNIENEDPLNVVLASPDGVKRIKVMAIINSYSYPSLSFPQSTHWLANLRTLRLSRLLLGDLSFLVNLTRLEILDLGWCQFNELPKRMENLKKLKLLDLSYCKIQGNLNCEAFSQLEELYALGYDALNFMRIEDLVTLPSLQRFIIQIGCFKGIDYERSIKVLHLRDFNISGIGASKQNILQRADDVCLDDLHGCKNIIPDMVRVVGSMNELANLCFRECSGMECLIDTTHHDDVDTFQVDALLPRLIKLELSEMDNLKEVCRGPPLSALGFLKNLEQLFIRRCSQLHNIFPESCNLCNLKILNIGNYDFYEFIGWDDDCHTSVAALFSMSVARSLQQLEVLHIEKCKKLEYIVTSDGEDGTNTGHNSHSMFPNLKKLFISSCPKLEFILPISFVQQGLLQLQNIEISDASALKYVFGQYEHEAHSSLGNQVQITLPPLKVFRLQNLDNLLGICPESHHLRYPSLEKLDWQSCPKLTTSCISETIASEQRQQHLSKGVAVDKDQQKYFTSKLQHLNLGALLQLQFLWSGTTPGEVLSFLHLQRLELSYCTNMQSVFSVAIERNLPELTSLSIHHCEELEEIISENEGSQNLSNEVCFPKLSALEIKNCNKLKSLFSVVMARMLPRLCSIHISGAAQLEEAFRHGSKNRAENEDQIALRSSREITLEILPNLQAPTHQELFTPCLGGTQVTPFSHRTEKRQVYWLITSTSNQLCGKQRLSAALQAFLNFEYLWLEQCTAEGIFQLQVEGELVSNSEWKPLNSNLHGLELSDLPDLKFIWNGFSKFLNLEKLKNVSLYRCPKLKTIFSPGIVRCLPMLESLHIRNSEELEEIMSSDCSHQVCFPRLYLIEVYECNKLKCLFYDFMASHFPELHSLQIGECSQLEQAFGFKGEADDKIRQGWDGERIKLFPKLRHLGLTSLPIFFEIYPGFNLRLDGHSVMDCPKYNSTSTGASSSCVLPTTQTESLDGA